MSTLPTLIFTHGGWHGPGYWNPVVSILASQGFRSIAPHLLFGASEKPITSLEPVIEQVIELVAGETSKGNDVVIINHSFGSYAGCSAIRGFTTTDSSKLPGPNFGRVLGILTIAGFFPETEVSFNDMIAAAQNPSTAGDPGAVGQLPFTPTEEGWIKFTGDSHRLFYNDLSTGEAQKWGSELEKLSRFAFDTRKMVYAGWKDVPAWYLLCKADAMMTPPQQEAAVKKARDGGGNITTREIDAGHSPMLSRPYEVAQIVQEAVAAFCG